MLTRFFFWGVGEGDSVVMVVEGRGGWLRVARYGQVWCNGHDAENNSDDEDPLYLRVRGCV